MMRRRPNHHYLEPEDDGLVNFRGQLITPEKVQAKCRYLMAGFDDMTETERYAWNYATSTPAFNASSSPLHYTSEQSKAAIKRAGALALMDELGL